MDTRYLILGGLMILFGILYFVGSPWILNKKFKKDQRVKPYLRKVGADFVIMGIVLCAWGFWASAVAENIFAKVLFILIIVLGLLYWLLTNQKFSKSIHSSPNENN